MDQRLVQHSRQWGVAHGKDDMVNLPQLPSQPSSRPRSGPRPHRQVSRSVSTKLQAIPLTSPVSFHFPRLVCHAPPSFARSTRSQLPPAFDGFNALSAGHPQLPSRTHLLVGLSDLETRGPFRCDGARFYSSLQPVRRGRADADE